MNLVRALHFPGFLVLNTSIVFKPGSKSSDCRLKRRDKKNEGDVTNGGLPTDGLLKAILLLVLLGLASDRPLDGLLSDSVGKRVLGNLRPPVAIMNFPILVIDPPARYVFIVLPNGCHMFNPVLYTEHLPDSNLLVGLSSKKGGNPKGLLTRLVVVVAAPGLHKYIDPPSIVV